MKKTWFDRLPLLATVFLLDCGQAEDPPASTRRAPPDSPAEWPAAEKIPSNSAALPGPDALDRIGRSDYVWIWPVEMGEAWGWSTPALSDEVLASLQPDTRYAFRRCTFTCSEPEELRTAPAVEIPIFTAVLTPPNTVTLSWTTSGGSPGQPVHIYGPWHDPAAGTFALNVGFRFEQQNMSGLSFRARPGRHRYLLSLPTARGEVTRTVEIDVPAPAAPSVAADKLTLYAPLLQDTAIEWDNASPAHFVRIVRFEDGARFETAPGASSYLLSADYLESLGQGSHRFGLFMCQSMAGLSPRMNGDLCSARAEITLELGAAQFTSPRRVHVATAGGATVSWTATGQFSFVDAPSLFIWGAVVVGNSYSFDDLPPGVHNVTVTSCTLYPPTCAQLANVAGVAGTVEYLASPLEFYFGYVTAGVSVLARIRTSDGSLVEIFAPVDGFLHYTHAVLGAEVTTATVLCSIRTGEFDKIQLVVGPRPFERKHWTADFDAAASIGHVVPDYGHFAIGNTMPVLASQDGNVWAAGEFAEGSVVHIFESSSSGYELAPFVAPVLQKPNDGRLLPVQPFGLVNGAGQSVTKQEIVIEAGRYVWTINGGYSQPTSRPDYNRLLRFDRRGVDLHTTPADDRFCVFHVPFEGANVMGIAWDEAAHRIWYVESRNPKAAIPVLAWFDPDELPCENFIDYSDSYAVAAASTRYCASPSETHCIHTVPLVDWEEQERRLYFAAHVAVDAEAVWVAGFFSANVARYDRASERVDVLNVPITSGLAKIVGPGPWQLLSRDDFLYFTEFFDGDVVRLDKRMLALDPSLCKRTVADGTNPCMSEIHASSQLKELKIHGDRLHFAGYEEFGYIDLSSWTPGALYRVQDLPRDEERRKRGEVLSGDLSVGPGGMVVLNDYMGHQVFRLYPR